MGYYGRLDLKLKAQNLRRQGRSYNEIMQKMHLSKSTVSDWCKDIQLTDKQLYKLYENKKTGALKGSIVAARLKQKARKMQTEELFKKGKKEVGILNKRDRFIAGIALYAAEGTKVDKGCCFSNSDPALIKFMTDWFREFGGVPIAKFRGALWLHEGLNETEAKKFWSSVANIPVHQFYKSYIAINKKHSRKIRKNLHNYGVFSFYVSDVTLLRKVMGWIGGILQKPWYNNRVH